jgi:hypothetical protein
MKLLCLLSLLLTGCMHKPLTPGQTLLMTAPRRSSTPGLVERCYYDVQTPRDQQHTQDMYCYDQARRQRP